MERSDPAARAIREDLARGEAMRAYDAIRDRSAAEGEDLVLAELEARALVALGARADASRKLVGLIEKGHRTPEILGFRASLAKDEALRSPVGEARDAMLATALDHYRQAWELFEQYWAGINVATLALACGDMEEASRVARQVIRLLEAHGNLDGDIEEDVWSSGSLGEAYLVLGNCDEARRHYETCARVAARHEAWSDLKSVRKNFDLIVSSPFGASLSEDAAALRQVLSTPPVAICVGHMVDPPERAVPRFPPQLEKPAKQAIARWVKDNMPCHAFSSMACGTDLLFQEVTQEASIRRHALTPFPPDVFRERSVHRPDDPSWGERFDRLWASADRTRVAARWPIAWEPLCFEFGNQYITGLAKMKAEELETDLIGIALWDGAPGENAGGTYSVLKMWHAAGLVRPIATLDPRSLATRVDVIAQEATAPLLASSPPKPDLPRNAGIVGLLFADAHGFSKLSEAQADVFVDEYLGHAAEAFAPYAEHAYEVNTWGDGLFFVIRDLERLGRFALDLRDRMEEAKTDLVGKGLPQDLELRIALHAGPVRFLTDPLTGRQRVSGTQVSHAARIEPVTPPGQIYASEPFAALSRARGIDAYRCTYVGETDLHKGHGRFPTYLVERA